MPKVVLERHEDSNTTYVIFWLLNPHSETTVACVGNDKLKGIIEGELKKKKYLLQNQNKHNF